jgi:hypothetical protein
MIRDVDLAVLERPPGGLSEGPAQADDDPIFFRNLPFAGVQHGGERPGDTLSTLELYPTPRLLLLLGLDWLISRQVDVINLSLGFTDPFDPDEPLQVAMRTAVERQIVVVVAAGNEGPEQGTLQELAQANWVLAVGASDADGGRLLKRSSRGLPAGPKPALVADGTDEVAPPMSPGTSFAAPKVSGLAAWTRCCLELSRSDLIATAEGPWGLETDWIMLPRVGFADTGYDPDKAQTTRGILAQQMFDRTQDRVRLVREDRERDWYAALVQWLRTSDVPCQVAVTPTEIRRALVLMSRPVAGAQAWEAGAGFIDGDQVNSFLANLTPSRWLSIFCPAAVTDETRSSLSELDGRLGALWDQPRTEIFRDLFWTGIQIVAARVVQPETQRA